MMSFEVRTKKWGSSLGIIIPKRIVEKQDIKEDENLEVDIKPKKVLVKDVFGMLEGKIKHPTQRIKDEMRAGWLSASDREQEKSTRNKTCHMQTASVMFML